MKIVKEIDYITFNKREALAGKKTSGFDESSNCKHIHDLI